MDAGGNIIIKLINLTCAIQNAYKINGHTCSVHFLRTAQNALHYYPPPQGGRVVRGLIMRGRGY